MQVDGLGLARPASLVRASGAGAAVDGRELAVLPNPHTLKEAKHVRLLLLPELLHVPALRAALRVSAGPGGCPPETAEPRPQAHGAQIFFWRIHTAARDTLRTAQCERSTHL